MADTDTGDIPPPRGEVLLEWGDTIPLELYAEVLTAIGRTGERLGFDVFMHTTTGTRTIYFRKRGTDAD